MKMDTRLSAPAYFSPLTALGALLLNLAGACAARLPIYSLHSAGASWQILDLLLLGM